MMRIILPERIAAGKKNNVEMEWLAVFAQICPLYLALAPANEQLSLLHSSPLLYTCEKYAFLRVYGVCAQYA
jgi:hypothetical protein